MTSPATHDETVAFFAAHDRFGLPEEDLHRLLPGDDAGGRCRRRAACCWKRPAGSPRVPTGTAACWRRMLRSGALDDIERRGIRHLFYFQVDNPLVDICGPEFVGYHLLAELGAVDAR